MEKRYFIVFLAYANKTNITWMSVEFVTFDGSYISKSTIEDWKRENGYSDFAMTGIVELIESDYNDWVNNFAGI